MTSAEKPKTSATAIVSSDPIEVSTPASTDAPAPSTSALQALFGKKIKPLPPTHLETTIAKKELSEEKKKDSPISITDPDEDTSEIKTPPMTPRSPVAPMPTILELKAPSKPLTSNFLHFYWINIIY
jgi:hypothetical protein